MRSNGHLLDSLGWTAIGCRVWGGGNPRFFCSYKLGWLTKTSGRKFLSEILDNLQNAPKKCSPSGKKRKKKTPRKYHLLYIIDYAMIFRFGGLEAFRFRGDFSPLSSSNVVSHSARSFIWAAPRRVEDPSKQKSHPQGPIRIFWNWLVGGWLNHPVEKYAWKSKMGEHLPQGFGGKIKNVWNHHLVVLWWCWFFCVWIFDVDFFWNVASCRRLIVSKLTLANHAHSFLFHTKHVVSYNPQGLRWNTTPKRST